MPEEPFEVWRTEDEGATFVFSHSDNRLTTGALILKPGAKLPKHSRPLGYENLTQLSGKSEMTIYDMSDIEKVEKTVELQTGDVLKMQKGQWHVHANTYDEISITLFKLVGDITDIMKTLRESNVNVKLIEK
jgi:quercetin dioxygenase-like cupin family protein